MILIYLRSLWEEICRFTICSFVSSLVTVTIWEAAPLLNWQWQKLCLTRILSENNFLYLWCALLHRANNIFIPGGKNVSADSEVMCENKSILQNHDSLTYYNSF